MSQIELCRHCRQPLPPQERGGIYLPARKAAIFDTIQRFPGITAEGIAANIEDDRRGNTHRVQQHIFQINELLAGTHVKIKSQKFGIWSSYHVVNSAKKAARKAA